MANVGFKMGLQSALDALLTAGTGANATPGTFYLTSDTNRLYIGKDDKSIAPVNAGIITVDKIKYEAIDAAGLTYLPILNTAEDKKKAIGNYYYAKKENILCVFNGDQWVQINSVVTNTNMSIDLTDNSNSVEIKTTVSQSAGKDVEDYYTIAGTNGIGVSASGDIVTLSAEQVKVGVASAASGASVSLTSSLVDENEKDFNIVSGSSNVTVKASGKNIEISAKDTIINDVITTLEDGDNAVTFTTKLIPSEGAEMDDSITFAAAQGITVDSTGKTLTISADPVELGVAAIANNGGATVSLTSDLIDSINKDFNIIPGANVGIVAEGKNITISAVDKDTTVDSLAFKAENEGFTLTLTPSEGADVEAAINPIIKYGNSTNKVQASFVDGFANLDIYTKGETDNLIQDKLRLFNAMTYKGVINSEDAIPDINVSVGDTYLISKDGFSYGEDIYPAGTMMIATSSYQNDSGEIDGFIPVTPENYIVWEFVTGSQVDTQYTLTAIDHGIQLSANRGAENAGTLTIKDGAAENEDAANDIVVSVGNTTGNKQELVVSHKLYGDVEATAGTAAVMGNNTTLTFTAVDSIEVSNGHIKSFTTKEVTVRDTNATLTKNEAKVENITNGVTVNHTVALTPSAGADSEITSNFSIESTSLEITNNGVAGSGIVMNLVWGTF